MSNNFGSISVSSQRPYEATKFMLSQRISGYGEIFEEVPESDMQPGDVVLFPLDSPSEFLRKVFKHAAVYCGDGEVIHFQQTGNTSRGSWIIKEGFYAMKKERGKCRIYRKKDGINLQAFRSKVKKAMNCEAKYDLGENNCIHFALYLLGLTEFYMQLVEFQTEGRVALTFPISALCERRNSVRGSSSHDPPEDSPTPATSGASAFSLEH